MPSGEARHAECWKLSVFVLAVDFAYISVMYLRTAFGLQVMTFTCGVSGTIPGTELDGG